MTIYHFSTTCYVRLFSHDYPLCETFNTSLYLGVTTSPLTLNATYLECDKHRDPFRIDADTMSENGLHHHDQKLFYKNKERDSKVFLDIVGVKDKSKLMFVEDSISQEKRYLEMRMNAKMERTTKYISEISLEVDRLAGQVSALESILSKGGKVSEMNVLNLIDLLINQLLKLDSIMVDEDVKMKREMQVKEFKRMLKLRIC
ncbi:BAG family molecular chaperone regulator 3 [Glycine max]|nr:BAG family molecular chaperone regulator 3 [Glycine max]